MAKRSPLLLCEFDAPDDPMAAVPPPRLSGCCINQQSSKSSNQAQQTSNPVVNQPGLNLLTQNAQNAPGNIANALTPFNGMLGAPLSQGQQQAISAAPGMLTAGQPALNSATQAAGGLLGYQAPQVAASLAAPGQSSAAGYTPNMLGAAPQMNAATANGATVNPTSSVAWNPVAQQSGTSNVSTGTAAPGMSQYFDPYTQQVVNATNADINLQRQQALVGNNEAATMQNAYGGNRQGVADALTNKYYDMNTAQTDAALRQAGFNTALGASQQDVANKLTASQANASNQLATNQMNANIALANSQGGLTAGTTNAANTLTANMQNAANTQQTGLFNAGNQQAASMYNTGLLGQILQGNQAALNTAGQFNAGNQQQTSLQNAANTQQANLANAGALNNMGQFNVSSNLASAGVQQGAANSMANMSAQQQQAFGNYVNSLLSTGAVDQATVQNNLTAIYNQYVQQQQAQLQGQGLLNQSVGLVPYSLGQTSQGTSSGTNTQSGFGFNLPGGWLGSSAGIKG